MDPSTGKHRAVVTALHCFGRDGARIPLHQCDVVRHLSLKLQHGHLQPPPALRVIHASSCRLLLATCLPLPSPMDSDEKHMLSWSEDA